MITDFFNIGRYLVEFSYYHILSLEDGDAN